jgi:hypothetical protein
MTLPTARAVRANTAVAKTLDLIPGALPLLGKSCWVAKAAEPHADRVGLDFALAPFPRRESEHPVSAPAAEPRPRSRARSRAA